jgi:hypothetical protein
MKTIVFLSLMITMLVMVPRADAANPESQRQMAYIHYQVVVKTNLVPGQELCPSLVMITDGNGSAVNGSQVYRPYISTYHFYELGPVTGTREALIMVIPARYDALCPAVPEPVAVHSTFMSGRTYPYTLFYGPNPPNPSPIPLPISMQ